MNFPEIELGLGIYVEKFVKWLTVEHGGFFEAVSDGLLAFLLGVEKLLIAIPWWLFLVLIFVAAWRTTKLQSAFLYTGLIFLIGVFGYWELMMMTLAIVLTAVIISILFGIPVGIAMAYSDKFNDFNRPILDGMQTLPSFVYLIPALMLFGMGKVPAVFATTIYAIPPIIRLTNLGIRGVSKEMVEAAHAFGSNDWQTLIKVQVPQAMPSIMTGINQTTMMALAMVVVASMIGAKGLGMEVLTSINRIDIATGFDAGISIVFLAIIIDRLSQGVASRFKYPGQ